MRENEFTKGLEASLQVYLAGINQGKVPKLHMRPADARAIYNMGYMAALDEIDAKVMAQTPCGDPRCGEGCCKPK